jgi:hypothetical protein
MVPAISELGKDDLDDDLVGAEGFEPPTYAL